jgi:hypothetical protein
VSGTAVPAGKNGLISVQTQLFRPEISHAAAYSMTSATESSVNSTETASNSIEPASNSTESGPGPVEPAPASLKPSIISVKSYGSSIRPAPGSIECCANLIGGARGALESGAESVECIQCSGAVRPDSVYFRPALTQPGPPFKAGCHASFTASDPAWALRAADSLQSWQPNP